MVAMSGSSVPSARLFLVTLATIIYRSAGQPLQLIACSQPDSFTVQITENENVVVYGTELLIRYNPRPEIHPLPGIDAVNVVYNESTIEFTGYMTSQYPASPLQESPERLSWTSSGTILGTGTLQKLSREDYAVRECRSFLPKNTESSDNLLPTVQNEIANYARNCVEKYVCKRLRVIRAEELQHTDKFQRSAPNTSAPNGIASYNSSQPNCPTAAATVDFNLNELVDFLINSTVNYIKHSNKSTITIPNVDESFVLGPFGAKCYFQASNGTFKDASSLKRTQDASISATGRTHFVKMGVGLSTAQFHYDYYHIKYGIMNLHGHVTGSVGGLALAISVEVDYNKECPLSLDYMKVTEIGNIKIDMTGLGPINGITSKILSWLSNMWRNKIVSLVEVNVKHIIDELLNDVVCETYRKVIAGNATIVTLS